MRYDVSPAALDDIEAAAVSTAAKDVSAAERLVEEIYDAFDLLARNPHLGHQRTDLTSLPVFFWTAYKRYAVVYRKAEPLQVVRVLAWARDIAGLLADDSGSGPS